MIEVNRIPITLPRLPAEFHGYQLIQISDIHLDGGRNNHYLSEAVDLSNGCHPDLVAITGDFVTHAPSRFADELIRSLGRLSARDGVVAVLGNHDHSSCASEVRKILHQAGIIDLSNQIYTLRRGEACLHLAGVDDPMTGHARLDLILESLPKHGAAILLAHEPDYIEISAPTERFDMQLSGHSHGGQIRLPFLGPLFLPRYGRKYPQGLYRVGKTILYTNKGLGTVHLPLRFHCHPEIALFTLMKP